MYRPIMYFLFSDLFIFPNFIFFFQVVSDDAKGGDFLGGVGRVLGVFQAKSGVRGRSFSVWLWLGRSERKDFCITFLLYDYLGGSFYCVLGRGGQPKKLMFFVDVAGLRLF